MDVYSHRSVFSVQLEKCKKPPDRGRDGAAEVEPRRAKCSLVSPSMPTNSLCSPRNRVFSLINIPPELICVTSSRMSVWKLIFVPRGSEKVSESTVKAKIITVVEVTVSIYSPLQSSWTSQDMSSQSPSCNYIKHCGIMSTIDKIPRSV